jgi:hypothetical protein
MNDNDVNKHYSHKRNSSNTQAKLFYSSTRQKKERESVHWKYENNNIDRSQREKWETSTYMYIFILILSY